MLSSGILRWLGGNGIMDLDFRILYIFFRWVLAPADNDIIDIIHRFIFWIKKWSRASSLVFWFTNIAQYTKFWVDIDLGCLERSNYNYLAYIIGHAMRGPRCSVIKIYVLLSGSIRPCLQKCPWTKMQNIGKFLHFLTKFL